MSDTDASERPEKSRDRFWKIAAAGACFQAGSTAVDSATVVASLVYRLTGSAFAVGAASAVLRLGWLLPQFLVGYMAQSAPRRMPFYVFGAYGRAMVAGLIGGLLWFGADMPRSWLAAGFLLLWTCYAFVSGVVAVPYNDIVGRSIPSNARSRMLAWRFFVGGLLALGIAALARWMLDTGPMLKGYAAIFWVASVLMIISSSLFVSAGEPSQNLTTHEKTTEKGLAAFLAGGWDILRSDARFRLFLFSQWLGGATLMALPFYMVSALRQGLSAGDVGLLLGAQTTGALLSNPFWGRIGDRMGKLRLMQIVGGLRVLLPTAAILLLLAGAGKFAYAGLFLSIGAMMNGVTIGYLGFLMEMSPDDRRPAYSAYFNTLAAPAALLPLLGAAIVNLIALPAVFVAAVVAAVWQLALLARIGKEAT